MVVYLGRAKPERLLDEMIIELSVSSSGTPDTHGLWGLLGAGRYLPLPPHLALLYMLVHAIGISMVIGHAARSAVTVDENTF